MNEKAEMMIDYIMNNVMRKILPILMMVWPYVFVVLLFIGGNNETRMEIAVNMDFTLTAMVIVFNVINAFTYKGKNADIELARWGMWIKIAHIPFYLFVLMVVLLMVVVSVVPAMIFITPFVIVCLVVVAFCLMLTTSLYGACAMFQGVRRGNMSIVCAVVNIVLHCMFVTDTISAIIIFFKLRKKKD